MVKSVETNISWEHRPRPPLNVVQTDWISDVSWGHSHLHLELRVTRSLKTFVDTRSEVGRAGQVIKPGGI